MHVFLLRFRMLALGLIGLAIAACQNEPGPTALTGSRYQTTVVNGVAILHAPASQGLVPAGVDAEVIGPSGGEVETGGGRLRVPAGALKDPTLVTITGKVEGQYRYRFGPTGLEFKKPATLLIQVDPAELGVDPSRLRIAGANDLGTDWHVIGGAYDAAQGGVVAEIDHFSQYSIAID